MRRHCTRTLLCAALATILVNGVGGCAMPGNAAHPGPAAEPGSQENGYSQVTEPQSIAAWEARVQSHSATLYALLPATGGGATTTSPTGPAPPPTRAHPPTTSPSPGRTPARARARYPNRTTTVSKRSIRCRRIGRHVRAICYAARRICQIASRVGSEYTKAACQRNQRRCQSARNVTTRRGCTGCGSAKRRRKSNHTRRACLR